MSADPAYRSTHSGDCASHRFDFLASITLAIVAFVLYLPTLGGDFVYDARLTVLGNDYAHHTAHLWDVATLRVLHMDVMDNNRPVYLASVILNWALCGANPAGFHIVNILLHAIVAVLLFILCRNLTGRASTWIPFVAALIYTVHPLNCEPVAEISYRYDILVVAFILAGLNLATMFQPEFSGRNISIGVGCVACFFVAVGAKENGVAGPPALLCYWLLFRRGERRPGWIALCTASFLAVVFFLAARFALEPGTSIIFTARPRYPGGSLAAAMLVQPRIWFFYFRQIVWPRDLCADYGPYSIRNFEFIAALFITFAVIGLQMFLAARNRLFALGAALFWFALLPVSNLLPIYRPMADRFLYLPMAGVALMLASVPSGSASIRRIVLGISAVAALTLAGITLQREQVWRDSLALWSDTALKNPFSADAQSGLGSALFHAGRPAESTVAFERAITLAQGRVADQFACLALSLEALGRKKEADLAFKKAVALDARYAHPGILVQALIWEESDAGKLQVIACRN